jgi:3-phenylpropionate/cinnamic acid dioxygenase small subunit
MFVPSDGELIEFVVREARLLDRRQFAAWLDLFAEEGHYWMPLERDQTDPRLVASLMYEDKLLLKIRVERLASDRTYSQKPPSRCHHLLQTPLIEKRDEAANAYTTWTPLHYVETRGDEQMMLAAWATHHLGVIDGAIRIKLKRVDLVNSDAAFPSIQLFV